MIEVIDNLFSVEEQNELENLLVYNNNFPYFYSSDTIDKEYKNIFLKDRRIISQSQFCHLLYGDKKVNSPFFDTIFSKFKSKSIANLNPYRLKVNLLQNHIKRKRNVFHIPHFDHINNKALSMIYYVNETDGDTYFFEENYEGTLPEKIKVHKKVSPQKGRIVIFNSNRFHASSPPFFYEKRCVINMILNV